MPRGSVFNPSSSLAQPIAHLFLIVAVIMGLILLLVIALVLYACVRYRKRGNQQEPRQNYGQRRLEIAWTIAPMLVLIFIFVITMHAMEQSNPVASTQRQPDLVIIGHQWWWEARYTGSNVVAANEIHIPVGQRFLVRLESADVIHDWWVAPLGPKMDAIPGHPNVFWLEADYAGQYIGTCAEYCGAEHAWMRILVVAQPESEFEQWTAHQRDAAETLSLSSEAEQGAKLFQQFTCSTCHTITGVSENGHLGPDLTHVASRETLAAGVITNTPENLLKWISNPQAVKPECHMPNFELSPEQAHQLGAYLAALK